ncbi:hypothetical protein DSECCO2_175060 [anaerobic digester metagenome]
MLTRIRVAPTDVPAGIVMVPVTAVLLVAEGASTSSPASSKSLSLFRSTQILQPSAYDEPPKPGVSVTLYAVPTVMVMVFEVKSV